MGQLRQAELKSDGDRDLMLLGVKANGAVKGRILVMTLEQRYRNSSDRNTEITYTFPLPFGAVLMDVEVTLNGQVLKGEVSPRTAARARYEEAISEGNSSIMLEKNQDGSFTLELGNLMAREECNIMVRYAQVLATEHGQVRLMLPTTIAPRYGNPLIQGKLLPHQAPVTDITAEYPFDITLMLMGDMAWSNVSSPSHKTSYIRNKDDLVIKLSQRGYLDRDFVLVISNLKNDSDGLASLDSYAEGQSALMAFFSPSIESTANQAMSAKLLVDCSASMAGDSIEAARRALLEIVNGLNPEDKFTLSKFGNNVEHRSRGLWSGTGRAKASAKRWIDNVNADMGGTEMAAALISTIAIPDNGKSDILLITDGEIEGIDEVIEVAKKSNQRVFIVAIGASPSEVHLRRLALATEGHCDFVAPGEDVEPAVIRMSSRMRAARATNLRVEWPKSLVVRWEQTAQCHAFENDALNVCAFIDTPADWSEVTTAKLWGRIDGQGAELLLAEAPMTVTESSTNITARLTAYSKYQEIRNDIELVGAAESLSNAQQLAVTYRLVTDETNFILVHERSEENKAQEMPDAHKVPQMLAAGWGGTGSVVTTSMTAQGTSPSFSYSVADNQPIYQSLATPSVWRTNRTAAAARVDALSNAGMDDFEIPAFLRKQVDDSSDGDAATYGQTARQSIDKRNPLLWVAKDSSHGRLKTENDSGFYGLTPAGVDRWLTINRQSLWPKTYAELLDLGVPLSICEWLEFEIGIGNEESTVVLTFLTVVHELGLARAVLFKGVAQTIKPAIFAGKPTNIEGEIATCIRLSLNGATATVWPKSVIDFPEIAN